MKLVRSNTPRTQDSTSIHSPPQVITGEEAPAKMQEGSGNIDQEHEDLSSDIHTLRMALGYSQSQNAEEDVDYVYTFGSGTC